VTSRVFSEAFAVGRRSLRPRLDAYHTFGSQPIRPRKATIFISE
jgi:hypothetical protein